MAYIYNPERKTNKDQNSGYAGLDASGNVSVTILGDGSANSTTFLRGDNSWAVPYADFNNYRKTGSTNYYCGAITSFSTSGGFSNLDDLYVSPFIVPKSITIDRLAVEVTTAVTNCTGAGAKLGIYDDFLLYPYNLLGEGLMGGGFLDSTGIRTTTIDLTLSPGLYWLAYFVHTPTSCITPPTVRSAIFEPILGIGNNGSTTFNLPLHGYLKSGTNYSAGLPGMFPSLATELTTDISIPIVAVRI